MLADSHHHGSHWCSASQETADLQMTNGHVANQLQGCCDTPHWTEVSDIQLVEEQAAQISKLLLQLYDVTHTVVHVPAMLTHSLCHTEQHCVTLSNIVSH